MIFSRSAVIYWPDRDRTLNLEEQKKVIPATVPSSALLANPDTFTEEKQIVLMVSDPDSDQITQWISELDLLVGECLDVELKVVTAKVFKAIQGCAPPLINHLVKGLRDDGTLGLDQGRIGGVISELFPTLSGDTWKVLPTNEKLQGSSRRVVGDRLHKERVDLRGMRTFTLDGNGTHTFDGGVSVTPVADGGTRIRYVIADLPASSIDFGSSLDISARRLNRVLTDHREGDRVRLVPLLPRSLREQASLVAGADRTAAVVSFVIDKNGVIHTDSPTVVPALVNVDWNADIVEAEKIIAGGDGRFQHELRQLQRAFNRLPVLDPDVYEGSDSLANNEAGKMVIRLSMIVNELLGGMLARANVAAPFREVSYSANPAVMKLFNSLSDAGLLGELGTLPIHTQLYNFSKDARCSGELRRAIIDTLSSCSRFVPTASLGHQRIGLGDYVHATAPLRRYDSQLVIRQLYAMLLDEPPIPTEVMAVLCADLGVSSRNRSRMQASLDLLNELNEGRRWMNGSVMARVSKVAEGRIEVTLGNTMAAVSGKLFRSEPYRVGEMLKAEIVSFDLERRELQVRIHE